MGRTTRPLVALAIAVATFTAATAARADSASVARAQGLFDEAIALMAAGKSAEACPKLEESDRLDPGMGTEYRLAECYESAGKITSAWTVFRAVADAAQREGKGERAAVAIRRAADLAPRLPMVLVEVRDASSPPGLQVLRDGKSIPAAELNHKFPVDPGEHLISAKAPGRIGWARSISAPERTTTVVIIPALGDGSSPSSPVSMLTAEPTPLPPPATEGLSTPRIAALAAGGVGVAGLVVGTVFGLHAGSQWRAAQKTCADPVKGESCSADGVQLGKDAGGSATLSTLGFVIGGAGLLTGAILWLRFAPPRAPVSSVAITPALGPGIGGARLQGTF
jgi:hypothetical protein